MTAGVRARLAIALTAGTAALTLLLATPANAAHPSPNLLELSRDGVHYTPRKVPHIFKNTAGYVPGESRSGTVWVRNKSNEDAHFSLAVANTDRGGELVLPGYFEFSAATDTKRTSARTLPAPGHCNPVMDGWTLAAGEAIRLNLNLNLALDAPNATRNQTSSFDVVFLLQGTNGGQLVSPCAAASNAPGPGVSLGRAPVTSGTANGPIASEAATNPRIANVAKSAVIMDYVPTGASSDGSTHWTPLLVPNPGEPLAALAQSNVVATSRSPWPWLFTLSAGLYLMISFRSRRRKQ